jgi:hypothetical protein
MDQKDRQELHRLLSALLDGALEPAQQDRLGQMLQLHAEARDLYLAYFSLHADLALRGDLRDGTPAARPATGSAALQQPMAAERSTIDPQRPFPARSTSTLRFGASRRTRFLVGGALGLAGLAAALLLLLSAGWLRLKNGPPHLSDDSEAVDHTVAVLLQTPGAAWEETGLPTRAGAPLPPGWLRLKSGFAHIEFYNGATVILEGPAQFQLISRTSAYCASGKLRAMVPPQAQGFTIGSPKLDLVDRGTEFGLEVSASGQTEVHVFQGKVELYTPGSKRDGSSAQELTTGQGGRLDDAGNVRPIALNADAFLTAQKLAERSRAETLVRQQSWLAASEALRRDPHLVVYYPFQAEQSWSRTLLDQAGDRRCPHDGAIVGCSWVTGRWPGKQGLEFKRVSDRVRLNVPGEFDALTLMAWVRVDALPNVNNSLFMADGWPEGAPHWQIGSTGTLILGVKAPAKTRNPHYHAPDILQPERLGQWTHLAVVYDRDSGQVTHYVDGRPVAQEAMPVNIPLSIGNAEIGNWNVGAGRASQPIRYFSGCMDEFMLFDRALDPHEIDQFYKQGRPGF